MAPVPRECAEAAARAWRSGARLEAEQEILRRVMAQAGPPALPPSRPPALALTQPARTLATLPPWRSPPPSCPRGASVSWCYPSAIGASIPPPLARVADSPRGLPLRRGSPRGRPECSSGCRLRSQRAAATRRPLALLAMAARGARRRRGAHSDDCAQARGRLPLALWCVCQCGDVRGWPS